jgi:hypothetical protein
LLAATPLLLSTTRRGMRRVKTVESRKAGSFGKSNVAASKTISYSSESLFVPMEQSISIENCRLVMCTAEPAGGGVKGGSEGGDRGGGAEGALVFDVLIFDVLMFVSESRRPLLT